MNHQNARFIELVQIVACRSNLEFVHIQLALDACTNNLLNRCFGCQDCGWSAGFASGFCKNLQESAKTNSRLPTRVFLRPVSVYHICILYREQFQRVTSQKNHKTRTCGRILAVFSLDSNPSAYLARSVVGNASLVTLRVTISSENSVLFLLAPSPLEIGRAHV